MAIVYKATITVSLDSYDELSDEEVLAIGDEAQRIMSRYEDHIRATLLLASEKTSPNVKLEET